MKGKLLILVFVLGAVSLAGEIAMARLIAPSWGSGTLVWSTVIAIVLLALAGGYWFGGRRADKYPSITALALWLLPGALLLLLQPWIAKPLLQGGPLWFLLFILLGATAFFFLGAASPWALRLLDTDPEHSGALAGKLFAAGTIGSFLGTLLSAIILLPELGTGRTFFLLGFLALLVIGWLEPKILLLLPLPLLLWITWSSSSSVPGVLWEGESAEQHLRVRELNGGERVLELDDGRDIQSLYRPGSNFSGDLWDAPLFLWASRNADPGSLLVLGNGAGTTLSAWKRSYQGKAVGVELDPQITELARQYFNLQKDARVLHGDARRQLRGLEERFNNIFLDTYDANYIPFHLLTEEFFLLLQKRLQPGGLLLVNVQPRGSDIVSIIGRTSQKAFPFGKIWKYSENNSYILLSEDKIENKELLARLDLIPRPLRKEARRASKEIDSLNRQGDLWTDDLAPAERYSR